MDPTRHRRDAARGDPQHDGPGVGAGGAGQLVGPDAVSDWDGHAPPTTHVELHTEERSATVGPIAGWLRWFGLGRLVAAVVATVIVVAGGWWLVHAPAPGAEELLPVASSVASGAPGAAGDATSSPAMSPAMSPPTSTSATVVVHVSGRVREPGVYTIPAGSRVIDALTAAGGPTPEALVDEINLAAVVVDGSLIRLPGPGDPPVADPAGSTGSATPAGPVDLNHASAQELQRLPGVGPSTAAAIVAYRTEHGPFAAVEDLLEVRGIGPAKLEALRDEARV